MLILHCDDAEQGKDGWYQVKASFRCGPRANKRVEGKGQC